MIQSELCNVVYIISSRKNSSRKNKTNQQNKKILPHSLMEVSEEEGMISKLSSLSCSSLNILCTM
jgi:hypothetical protein